MQIEEEHVLPRFEDADAGEGAVLPAGFRDEIGMAPPEPTPSRIRTRFDPEGQGPRQGMTFGENVAGAFRSGTIEGAAREAAELATARREVPTETRDLTALEYLEPFAAGPISPEAAEAARQEARGQIFDQIAYDLAPVAFTPRSVAGSLAGQIIAPTNLLAFGGGVASKALAARGFGKTVQAAAGTAIAAGVTDAATQTVRRGSGAQAEFDIPQAVIAPIAGGLIGAGAHVAGEAIGKGAGSVWKFVKGREAPAPQADIDLPREAIDAPGARNMAALADEDPSLRSGPADPAETAAKYSDPIPDGDTASVTLPEQAVEASTMDPAAVVADPDAAAARAAADVPEGLPPVPEGHVRMFHGGTAPGPGETRWTSPDFQYARDYRAGDRPNDVFYVDVPEGHPALQTVIPAEDLASMPGTKQRYLNSELPPDIAQGMKPASAQRGPEAPQLASEARQVLDQIDPRIGPAIEQALAPAPARQALALVRQNFDPAAPPKEPGQLDRRAYAIERDGERVGTVVMKVDGDVAEIRDIYGEIQGTSDQRNVLGPAAISTLLRQFLAENPEIRRLTGERVSGARRGGGHGSVGTGEHIDVRLPDVRRGPTAIAQTQGGKPLSLMQFIARNGGLALDGEASARDLGRVFVPGAGPLARKNGRTIDGHWREALIDAGYLPADAEGTTARNVEREVFDALDREQRGERTYSAYDDVPVASEIDTLHREVEAEAKKVAKALKKAGISERETDPRTLTDAGELMWRGEETDALAAYERAAMMRAVRNEDDAARASIAFGDLPPGWDDDAVLGRAARADGAALRGEGAGRTGSGQEGGPDRPGRELPGAGEGGQGSQRIDATAQEAGSAQAAAIAPERLQERHARAAAAVREEADSIGTLLFRRSAGTDGDRAPRRLTFDSPLSGERRVTRAWAEKEIVQRYDQIASLEAEQAGERRIAPIRAQIEGLEKLLPKFDQDLPRGRPFKPQRVIDAGDGLVVRILDRGDQRTYRLFVQGEDRQPKRALGYVDLDQHADGRWEAMMLHVSAQDRGRGAATTLYKAVEKDLGQERIPSGALLPDGYAFWMKRDPEKVRFHQQVGEQYLSPKRIAAYLKSEAYEGKERAALQAALDRVPPEGKTPEAMALQFRKRVRTEAFEEPDQIVQGRPLENQGTADIPGDARPARLDALGQKLAADFETVLRTGGVQSGARGQYGVSTGVVRVRSLQDLGTLAHEVGHNLHLSPETAALIDPIVVRNRAELAPLGAGEGARGDAEAFAELFRLYTTGRGYAARTYPAATADLDRVLRTAMPDRAVALDALRGELDVIHNASSGAIVSSDVITPKPDGLFRRILDLFGTDFIGVAVSDPRGGVFYQWRDALYTRMLSPHHPLNRSMEALGRLYRANTGKALDLLPMDDPYILARASAFSNSAARTMLEFGIRGARSDTPTGASFRDAIELAIGKRYTSEQWHDFGAYLAARRMVAEYARFMADEIPNPPGRLSAADYAQAVEEFGAKYPTFAEGAEKLYEFQRNALQRYYDKGLFTKEYLDASIARADYVPLLRDMDDMGVAPLTGGGARRDGTSMMKAFRGSERSVLNPLDAIFKKVHDLETAAALNDTKAALARLAEIAGPGSGFIAEPVPVNKLSSVRVDVVDALRTAGSRANVDNLDLGALIHQAEGLLGDDVFAHIFRQEPIKPGIEPITFYYVNGERRALRLSDGAFGAELYQALNRMTEPEKNIFFSVLQIGQALLKAGVTKSVGFIYRNFVRDQFTSGGTGGRAYIPFISALKGGFDVLRGDGDFERYLSYGGFAGGIITEAVEHSAFGKGAQNAFRQRAAYDPRRVLDATRKGAELSEAATRAGLFQSYLKQARELGFDDFNAGLYATFKANDYIDFRKVGSHLAVLNRWIPFLNATAQGTDKEARALFGDMVRLEAKRSRGEELSRIELDALKDARAAWVKTLGLGLIFGGGTAYLNSENPEWFGSAEWRRHRGYNLFPLGPVGNWFTMPKPFGFVRNVSDLFEHGVEYMIRQDPTIAGKLGRALAEAHTVPYTNPIIDTFYNTRANYDPFRNRPIVPPSLQDLPAAEQYTRYTSEIAKGIGQATGWSPMKVDYAAKNLGGSVAVDFLRNADSLIRWMQGKPGGKEKTIWDLPLARELVQNLAVGSDATTRFYNLVGQHAGSLEKGANAYGQKIASGDRHGAADYLRGLPENERAYATLVKQGFDGDDKLMHPLLLARAYTAVINGVSRQVGDDNLIPEGDLDRGNLTLSRRDAQPVQISGPTKEKLRNELDSLSMLTARNALISYGADGMEKVPYLSPADHFERIRLLAPEVARELRGRIAAKRLYDPDVVRERWPEAKARLLRDGENADLSDLEPRRPKSGRRERQKAMADE